MANVMMQTTASAGELGTAHNERQRAQGESPAQRLGGLDTGARGWRFAVATPAHRLLPGNHSDR